MVYSNLLGGERPECVYIDPMYPVGVVGRRANVKKETQILHHIIGESEVVLYNRFYIYLLFNYILTLILTNNPVLVYYLECKGRL